MDYHGGPYLVVNRTYGKTQKPIYLAIFTVNIWSYLLWPPVLVEQQQYKG